MQATKHLLSFILMLTSLAHFSFGQSATTIPSLLDSAYSHRLKADYSGNLVYLSQAEKLINEKTDPLIMAKVYAELSKQALIANTDYDKAKKYAEKSLQVGMESKQALAMAYGYSALSTWYHYLNIPDLTVENTQKALSLLKGNADLELKARLYYTMYGVYSSWDDVKKSDDYARMAIRSASAGKQYELLSNAYTARSIVMGYHYDQTKDQKYLDSMRTDLHRAISLYHTFPGQVGVRTYAIANLNLANFFFEYHPDSPKINQDSILYFARITQRVAHSFDKSYEIQGNVNGLLSEIAMMQGNTQDAESFLMDSYLHLKKAAVPAYYTLANVAQGLTQLYEHNGDYKKALFYQKEKLAFKDSVFNQASLQQVKKLEAQFENQRLSEALKTAAKEAKAKRTQNLLLWGICILLVLSLFFIYQFFKNKSRIQRQQAERLKKEKEDEKLKAVMQLKVEQEEQARLKSEQALLSLQKDQLEKEAMADALQIERKNTLLLELKDKLKKLETDDNRGTVDRLLREEMQIEEALEQSAKEFKHIRPAFFQKLKELSENKLTPLELKHCAYLLLKLSTKDMATVFHVDPKSIRVSKYRIKQKLKLDKNTDLDSFIQELK